MLNGRAMHKGSATFVPQKICCPRVQGVASSFNRRTLVGTRRTVVVSALPPEYGYVIASMAFAAAVNEWMIIEVAKARIAAKVDYPNAYADGDSEVEMKFNCTQRAHLNTLESLPVFMLVVVAMGTYYPITSAILGTLYTLARIVYFAGYSTGEPKNRGPGTYGAFLVYVVTVVTALVLGIKITGVLPIGKAVAPMA